MTDEPVTEENTEIIPLTKRNLKRIAKQSGMTLQEVALMRQLAQYTGQKFVRVRKAS